MKTIMKTIIIRMLLMINILLLLLISSSLSLRISLSSIHRRSKLVLFNKYDDYLVNMNSILNDSNDNDDDRLKQSYIPAMGKESLFYTIGNIKSLLPTEYDLIFTTFPGIRNETILNKWPDRDIDNIDNIIIKKSLELYNPSIITEKDINNEMEKYRKTILGLEKYRINNPGALAEKYCKMIKTCLLASSFTNYPNYKPANVPDGWGAAANALEYAGLMIKDHVYSNSNDNNELNGIYINSNIPVLYLDSLWKQVRVRLLDLDFSHNNNNSNNNNLSKTWDQKYFSQVEMNSEGAIMIKDMMLCIMRVAILAILSRYNKVRVIKSYDEDTNSIEIKGIGLLPSYSSIRNTLDLSFTINSDTDGNNDDGINYESDQFLLDMTVSQLNIP